jgi:hypothetical protein
MAARSAPESRVRGCDGLVAGTVVAAVHARTLTMSRDDNKPFTNQARPFEPELSN